MTVKIVFLLGAIGAGKSTALQMFHSKGATILSADAVVHDLYQTDAKLIEQIRSHFGPVLAGDGSVDRKLLTEHFRSHPEDILKLEEIVHPRVREKLSNAVDKAPDKIFVYELPISRPTTDFTLAQAIVVIDAPYEMRLQRIMARGLTREEAVQRLEFHPKPYIPDHMPVYIINNDADEARLMSQVTNIWEVISGD